GIAFMYRNEHDRRRRRGATLVRAAGLLAVAALGFGQTSSAQDTNASTNTFKSEAPPSRLPFEVADRDSAVTTRPVDRLVARTVTLDVREKALADVLSEIRDRSDCNIVIAPGVDEKVTLRLVDVPWRKALDLAVEQAGCVVVEDGPNLLRVEKP